MADWQLKHDTQDPAKIYEEKEALTCNGCIHKSSLWGVAICLKFDKVADAKCSRYKESE